MKVLLLTTHLNVGGIPRYVISLARHLSLLGHEVFVGSNGGEWEEELEKLSNVRAVKLPINTKSIVSPKIIKSFYILSCFLKEEKIDIVHSHTRVAQFLSYLLFKFKGIPYVTTYHRDYKAHLFRRLFKFQGVKAIAISKFIYNYMADELKIKKNMIEVIYNGIDVSEYEFKFKQDYGNVQSWKEQICHSVGEEDKSVFLGVVSRFVKEKNISSVIKTVPFILKKYPQARLAILGQGRLEFELRRLVEKMGLGDKVFFLKGIRVDSFLKGIDIFVSFSMNEPFGFSVLEAQLAGVPVVVSYSGAFKEIIEDKKTGIFVDYKNPDSVVEAFKMILQDKKLRKIMVENGERKVRNYFNAERMAKEISGLYKRVGDEKK